MEICHAEPYWRLSGRDLPQPRSCARSPLWNYGIKDVKFRRRTSNLQLALHLILTQIVDGPAGVSSPIKQARLANIQRQHALFVLHQILGVLTDDHIVLHPNDLWLENRASEGDEEAYFGGMEERRRGSTNRARDVGRGGEEGRGRGEIRSTFRLDKSLQIRRDRGKKRRVFKDLSAPPLVLASDIKIHSCCKGFKILPTVLHSLFDTCTLTLKNTKPESCDVPLQQSYHGASAGKMNAGWRHYSCLYSFIFLC